MPATFMTKKHLIKIAKLELDAWHNLPNGLVLIILFAFINRVTTGETLEETFQLCQPPIQDYEI